MSTSRGSSKRIRPQKHQNKTAFKNDLHDTSRKTKFLNALDVTGVCQRCKNIIEWKIKYKKYKPLSAPAKCVGCQQKAVKYAYHVLCGNCSKQKNVCAKCCKPVEDIEQVEEPQDTEIESMLKGLPERKRRTILRFIKKQNADGKVTSEIQSHVEELLSKMDNINLSDELDEFSDDEDISSSGDEEK